MFRNLSRGIRWETIFPFLVWSHIVNGRSVRSDIIAGLTGAVIVLPQGVAYALIAGLPPEYGLYTAIVTPIIAGLFGSSLHLVSGPTAAISIVVFSVISNLNPASPTEFLQYALTLTFMVGIFQFILGLLRFGSVVNFISHSVVIGFTAGAALVIATSQVKYILGITMPSGLHFVETWVHLFSEKSGIETGVLTIGLVTIFSTLLIKTFLPKWPNMLIGMAIGSALFVIMGGESFGGAKVGALPGKLPEFVLPSFSYEVWRQLLPGALTVGMLALIEAVSIARAIGVRSGQHIDGNQEFIGQGLSNVVGGLFSCYAGSGSFTRTGANYDSGAQTPLSGVFAAITLAVILISMPFLTEYLPMAAMAGIIMVISWNLIDWHHITHILKTGKRDSISMAVTFFATLIVGLEFAIYVGVLLSLVLHVHMISKPQLERLNADSFFIAGNELSSAELSIKETEIYRINGSFFFGSVDHIRAEISRILNTNKDLQNLIIVGSGINFVDIAGAETLRSECSRIQQAGVNLYLVRLKENAMKLVKKGGYLSGFEDCVFNTLQEAVNDIVRKNGN